MDNHDVDAARQYHESTKLTYINLGNKPPLHKSYPGLPSVPLPGEFPSPEMPTLEAVAGGAGSRPNPADQSGHPGPAAVSSSPDLASLARLLYYSAGLLHRRQLTGAGEVHYRAAASAGALYPIEVYVVSGDVAGLEAGIYHFSPADFALTRLRAGDHRGELAAATAGAEGVASAPMTLVFTAVFWRSAWKYRVRSYRYCLWDAGTMLANLLAAVRAGPDLPASVVAGFVDQEVNGLLGLDTEREAALCLVPVGASPSPPPPPGGAAGADGNGNTREDSLADGIKYQEIALAHAASALKSEAEVLAWRSASEPRASIPRGERSGGPGPGPPELTDRPGLSSAPLGATIRQRGSTRRFAREAIPLGHFRAILGSSTRPLPADFVAGDTGSLLGVYIIVNAVDGLPSGAYHYSQVSGSLELLREGAFREEAGHLCFEQALGADAAAVMYYLADLDRLLERYGNRGYRAAQLESGVLVGNAYLCAHSLGLGATGMTFYDDAVTEFFSPHAQGKSVMFLVALGATAATNRVRPFRSRVGAMLDSLARGAGHGSEPAR